VHLADENSDKLESTINDAWSNRPVNMQPVVTNHADTTEKPLHGALDKIKSVGHGFSKTERY
jgi:hypothetical protein